MQIKTIRALQHKKFRQKYSQFLAEGLKVVLELLKSERIIVDTLYITPEYREKIPVGLCSAVLKQEITENELKKISCLKTPQGLLAVCKTPLSASAPSFRKKKTLLLEAIRDPGNMGTIIRIADWFGIDQIICSSDCVDVYNAKAIQATMGSISRVPIYFMEPVTVLQKKDNVSALATTLHGVPPATIGKIDEGIIIIGNESKGLRQKTLQGADTQISIPRIGEAESLNAAVATGIVCSHLCL